MSPLQKRQLQKYLLRTVKCCRKKQNIHIHTHIPNTFYLRTCLFMRTEFTFHSILVRFTGIILRIARKVSSFMLPYISSKPFCKSVSEDCVNNEHSKDKNIGDKKYKALCIYHKRAGVYLNMRNNLSSKIGYIGVWQSNLWDVLGGLQLNISIFEIVSVYLCVERSESSLKLPLQHVMCALSHCSYLDASGHCGFTGR